MNKDPDYCNVLGFDLMVFFPDFLLVVVLVARPLLQISVLILNNLQNALPSCELYILS